MKFFQLLIFFGLYFSTYGGQALSQNITDQQKSVNYPIWNPKEMEINKRKGPTDTYSHSLHLRPPYYTGTMPMKYDAVETPGRGHAHGNPVVLIHKFKNHDNLYMYKSGVLVGVAAVDNKSKKLVAEAKISYTVNQSKQVVRMEEFHCISPDGTLLQKVR